MQDAALLASLVSAATAAVIVLMARRIVLLEERLAAVDGRSREVEERLARLEEGLEEAGRAARRLSLLEKAVAKALESYMAEDVLEKLRRKRRRRYIVFYVVTEDGSAPAPEEVEKALLRALERLAGQLAVAASRAQLVYYVPEKAAGILRASHETKYLVLAAMGLVRRVGDRRALIVPVRTTGTIKTAKRVLGLTLRELKK